MNIGIVTFHEAANYGAALQAYALQETVRSLGASPSFISLAEPASQEVQGSPQLLARLRNYPRLREERAKMKEYRDRRNSLFANFRQNLSIVAAGSVNERSRLNTIYDAFIVGSDQVWNHEIIGNNSAYFLDFADKEKRFAYAASFGVNALPEKLHPWYAVHLRDFTGLSVREASGQLLIRQLIGSEARLCLDPVFLLGKTDWEKLAARSAHFTLENENQHIFLYLVNLDTQLIRLAQNLALQSNMGIKVVTASLQGPLGAEAWCSTGVTDFVEHIRQASVVITDSFHGLAFALIFAKDFYVSGKVLDSPRGNRLSHLLAMIGLINRTCDNAPCCAIDWPRVHERLAVEQLSSLRYLRAIINQAPKSDLKSSRTVE